MPPLRLHPFLPLAFCLILITFSCNSSPESEISYNRDIRPILNAKCLSCHGGVKKNGNFSLLFREEALGITESGKVAIVPGNHASSELYKRIIHHDPEMRMPLDEDPLTEVEISLIAQWIDEGAKWEEHWAYVAPSEPRIPQTDSDWPREEWDHFILDELTLQGLSPAPEADRRTLIRRASLDLKGIPPTPAEVATYLEDQAPDAYERMIDRLLASPQYGERWASMWLDLARYADSKGYEKDPHRNIWRYRDWVIRAFNADMPFDQFTREQIAGDLLPDPGRNQLIATAFHRNSMTNTEGGTADEEFRILAVMDRVSTTFDIWQSTTIACVQCHSHPYDPFRHEDYYKLMAVFNNTQDSDLNDERPYIEVYEAEAETRIDEILAFIKREMPDRKISSGTPMRQIRRQVFFPRLIAIDADDFHNVLFSKNSINNRSSNANEGVDKQFYIRFDDIPVDQLSALSIAYSSPGNGAKARIKLNEMDGPVLAEVSFSKTDQDFRSLPVSLDAAVLATFTGTQSLIIELINDVQKFPEGAVHIREIVLDYGDKYNSSPDLMREQDKLLELSLKADRTPIMQERASSFARTQQVFERGNFMVKGTVVEPAVPEVLPALPTGSPRLALANWLISSENPLTARVIVNRFWEQLFGTGIVPTLEDFGTQGEKPSHPELLDYLALRFMHEHDWSVKQLLREIMCSATYRQASVLTPEKQEVDPYNVFLSRGPRFRLSAEQIRDQALAVSGLLYDTIGGPSVMPPQPDGIWQVVYSGSTWKTAEGRNRHRRGIYTYWRRTTPYPSMVAFDSPSREFCVSRRIRTNTPLQALVTLNDPVYLEAAEALARRMEEESERLEEQIAFGYELALCHPPDSMAIEILAHLYSQAQTEINQPEDMMIPVANRTESGEDSYDTTPDGFKLKDPMTVVANAILNLDSFVMKE